MDILVYPALRRAGIRFTPIKKITAGFILGAFSMVWAAVLQYYMLVPPSPLPSSPIIHLTNVLQLQNLRLLLQPGRLLQIPHQRLGRYRRLRPHCHL